MPLSRIYQGRVSSFQILTPEAQPPVSGKDLSSLNSAVYKHHATFQDGVNYYHLALASLAGDDPERPLSKMKVQVAAAWEAALPQNQDSWRAKMAKCLGLPADAEFAKVMGLLRHGSEGGPRARELAGELLLHKIEGDIQQAGRGYWPRFCDPKSNPTWDFSATALASAGGLTRLAEVLHSAEPSLADLRAVAGAMDLSWTVKLEPGRYFKAAGARARLTEAMEHFLKLVEEPGPKLAEVLSQHPEGAKEWQSMKERIAALPDELQVPGNRRASKDLTFATLLFQHFPSQFTAAVLRLSVAKPKKAVVKKVVKKSARRKDNAVTKAAVVEVPVFDFAALGDDPIKLGRGARGYVFPAFTSLSGWAVPAPGEPAWKEFDIAAFKEALKTVNQFKLKTEERNALLREAQRRLDYMEERTDVWRESADDEPGHKPFRLLSDPNFLLLEKLLKENGAESTATGGVHVPRDIYNASLRGYRAVKKDWQEKWENKEGAVEESDLLAVVTEYQRDHSYDIGDVSLFRALCARDYWPLWKPLTADEETARERDGRAKDMLQAYRQRTELKEDVERLVLPIRFTPAHARHSRRLFMFSDISGKQGAEFSKDAETVDVSIALETDGKLRPARVKLNYTAPRVARDEITDLTGTAEGMRWLQPMMKALGCPQPDMPTLDKCAVALMPEVRELRVKNTGGADSAEPKETILVADLLLNFPATLEPDRLIKHIGKQGRWYKQFNGTYNPKTKGLQTGLHLYWPGMENAPAEDDKLAWWNHPVTQREGFTGLSVDLGQRDAGAWALLATRCGGKFSKDKEAFIEIGIAGGEKWSTALLGAGMFRLPGEDARTGAPDEKGKRTPEHYGNAGRNASQTEWHEARRMAGDLGGEEAVSRLGETAEELSHPEQNEELLRIISRAQSRLARFHRWSCRVKEKTADVLDEIIGYGDVDADITRIATSADEKLRGLAEKRGIPVKDKDKNPVPLAKLEKAMREKGTEPVEKKFLPAAVAGDILARLTVIFSALRSLIEKSLVAVANRELPLRGRDWVWKKNDAAEKAWHLVQDNYDKEKNGRKIQGQRGLSFARIEQLETLRKRFMSLNRAMSLELEKETSVGVQDRNRRMPEPCQDILDKLDRLKEQRINQTAHMILAQALGVRLREPMTDKTTRREKDIHGEYEVIPGRKPVDFIVMEDLSRYLSSQGRGPGENGKLMKWCHRALLGKLKQMAEPFGLPVLEVAAAYSSRFCALTGVPGFRAEEVHDGHAKEFRWKRVLEKAEKEKPADDVQAAGVVFDLLEHWNLEQHEKRTADKNQPLRTLLVPRAGGPIFVPMIGNHVRQADINAAINLGVRAVASPTCLRARPKIRCALVDGKHQAVQGNKIEKAAAIVLTPPAKPSKEVAQQERTNYFVDEKRVARFDFGEARAGSVRVRVAAGMALWKSVKEGAWDRVRELNDARIAKWKAKADLRGPDNEIR